MTLQVNEKDTKTKILFTCNQEKADVSVECLYYSSSIHVTLSVAGVIALSILPNSNLLEPLYFSTNVQSAF